MWSLIDLHQAAILEISDTRNYSTRHPCGYFQEFVMGYKSIAVHLDTSERAPRRLEMALRLANKFEAHVTAVFAEFSPDPESFYVSAGPGDYYSAYEKRCTERVDALERLFKSELIRLHIPGEWIAVGRYAELAVLRQGRCADLIVTGQHDLSDPAPYITDRLAESLVMAGGRPVLLDPCIGDFPVLGNQIMVAWDGSREATRAVHDAMPFLMRAQCVTVVTLNEPAKRSVNRAASGADIATAMARHGVKVEARAIDGVHDVSIGNLLLSQAADLSADLLVMGAYGHTRWKEFVLGGATLAIMKTTTLPVLLSH
jgi:nucleotide-binding universal stress UspA family protein